MPINFRPYEDRAGEETRSRWSGSIDAIFNAYQQARERRMKEAMLPGQM